MGGFEVMVMDLWGGRWEICSKGRFQQVLGEQAEGKARADNLCWEDWCSDVQKSTIRADYITLIGGALLIFFPIRVEKFLALAGDWTHNLRS